MTVAAGVAVAAQIAEAERRKEAAKPMGYPTHNCKECQLMRCHGPEQTCVECQANMAISQAPTQQAQAGVCISYVEEALRALAASAQNSLNQANQQAGQTQHGQYNVPDFPVYIPYQGQKCELMFDDLKVPETVWSNRAEWHMREVSQYTICNDIEVVEEIFFGPENQD